MALEELELAKVEGFYDKVIINNDLQMAYELLETYIFTGESTDGGTIANPVQEPRKIEADTEVMIVEEDASAGVIAITIESATEMKNAAAPLGDSSNLDS